MTSPSLTPPGLTEVTIRVNGTNRTLAVDQRRSLLDLLRERLGLTGSKQRCDHGQCGACPCTRCWMRSSGTTRSSG